MPKKTANNNQWKGFVRCELSAAAKLALAERAQVATDTDIIEALMEVIEEGYKLSAATHRENQAVTVGFYDTQSGRSSHGYTLSAHGKTLRKALLALLYKHNVILKGDWTKHLKAVGDDDEDFG